MSSHCIVHVGCVVKPEEGEIVPNWVISLDIKIFWKKSSVLTENLRTFIFVYKDVCIILHIHFCMSY